jgi:hypothetical protein
MDRGGNHDAVRSALGSPEADDPTMGPAAPSPRDVAVTISPRSVLRVLVIVIAALVALSLATQLMVLAVEDFPLRRSLVALLYVDLERSLPTLFSTGAMATAASVCAAIAYGRRRLGATDVRYWVGLSVVFAVLAIDEFASLHERSIQPLRDLVSIEGGALWYAWVIPGIVVVGAFAVIVTPFLRRLPRSTRRGLLIAGALFVGGAIGVEMLSASVASDGSRMEPAYVLIVHVEEALEMLGIAVLMFTLLAYIPVGMPETRWTARVVARTQLPSTHLPSTHLP